LSMRSPWPFKEHAIDQTDGSIKQLTEEHWLLG
jgi:hypothetical protein